MNPGASAEFPARWVIHSAMSAVDDGLLPAGLKSPDKRSLQQVVQRVLIHLEWLDRYGIDVEARQMPRTTLPSNERIRAILALGGDLETARLPSRRSFGTCRDYALLTCSLFRNANIPARLRCGFAKYFGVNWEDHWVTEYWDEAVGDWSLCDSQMDETISKELGIDFDPLDVPRDQFVSGGNAWLLVRNGERQPHEFGHGEVRGLWFMMVNVVRDHLALHSRETSDWDRWREAPQEQRAIAARHYTWIDQLASSPGQLPEFPEPDWLRQAI